MESGWGVGLSRGALFSQSSSGGVSVPDFGYFPADVESNQLVLIKADLERGSQVISVFLG